MKIFKNRGFTLIEMLVVIAIIAILTGIIVTGLVGSKAKSRDAKRASDLSQIALAIEQYFDRCDVYPTPDTLSGNSVIDAITLNQTCSATNNGVPITLGNFISVIPTDPSGTGSPLKIASYGYAVNNTDTDYVLYTEFEASNSVLAQSAPNPTSWFPTSIFDCSNATNFHYCVRPN
jgi:prepilin-type N-terminal cleavage/methylation domain-containing protein